MLGGVTGALQGDSHLLGDAAEAMAVQLQCDGIGAIENQ